MTLVQYTALSVLRRDTGLSNAQLARRTFVRPQSMIQVITALERAGLITRAADEHHRRILRTELTARGEVVLDACEHEVDAMERAMLGELTGPQRAALREALDSCFEHLPRPTRA